MGIKYSFIDNIAYGTEDINDITRCLTGAGIAPFISKSSYNVSDLNVMTAAIVAAGVELGGCKCSAENAGTAEMTVSVAPGIIFFKSGVRLEVDEDGYIIAITPNTAGYIFAHHSPSLQKADIMFEAELPTDGEYVVLAEVSADSLVEDKREYAKSKVATMGKNVVWERLFERIDPILLGTRDGLNHYAIATVPDVDLSSFNYALLRHCDIPQCYAALYDLENKRHIFSICDGEYIGTNGVFSSGGGYRIAHYFEIIDNKPYITVSCSEGRLKYISSNIYEFLAVLM